MKEWLASIKKCYPDEILKKFPSLSEDIFSIFIVALKIRPSTIIFDGFRYVGGALEDKKEIILKLKKLPFINVDTFPLYDNARPTTQDILVYNHLLSTKKSIDRVVSFQEKKWKLGDWWLEIGTVMNKLNIAIGKLLGYIQPLSIDESFDGKKYFVDFKFEELNLEGRVSFGLCNITKENEEKIFSLLKKINKIIHSSLNLSIGDL